MPFALMTFVLAIVGVARQRFLAASVLGMLPRSLFFYWLGTKAPDVLALLRDPTRALCCKLVLIGLVRWRRCSDSTWCSTGLCSRCCGAGPPARILG
ncbi:MAG: hypothetical protein WKG07_27115 [Hymenobacter sp.]